MWSLVLFSVLISSVGIYFFARYSEKCSGGAGTKLRNLGEASGSSSNASTGSILNVDLNAKPSTRKLDKRLKFACSKGENKIETLSVKEGFPDLKAVQASDTANTGSTSTTDLNAKLSATKAKAYSQDTFIAADKETKSLDSGEDLYSLKAAKASLKTSDQQATKMSDSLDDLLDSALDDLDLEEPEHGNTEKSEVVERVAPVQAPKKDLSQYQRWQDALLVLEPEERIEWARAIAADSIAQSSATENKALSFAYHMNNSEDPSGLLSLVEGSQVITPTSPKALLLACLQKSILTVNKHDTGKFSPSEALELAFKQKIESDIGDLLSSSTIFEADVRAQKQRFKNCDNLLSSM